jgi:2',3'-cyclic-nucleotide 2'-phosphodiesterase (5'-nucleotidase family)
MRYLMRHTVLLLVLVTGVSCGGAQAVAPSPAQVDARLDPHAAMTAEPFTLTVLGTNDLHGHLESMPLFAGYVEALRALRSAPGKEHGAVLLLDAGDMFQGTLESNQDEGLPVVDVYNALKYDAAAIGNHEFDYGPLGPKGIPTETSDDPLGALKRNAERATFPLLASNIRTRDGLALPIPKVAPSAIRSVAWGSSELRVGIVGASTKDTLTTTISSNVRDLSMTSAAEAIRNEAKRLRANGASLVLGTMHLGGKCERADGNAIKQEGCSADEITEVLQALGPRALDGVVAGHTHSTMATSFLEVPVIESHSYGRAFGRIDYSLQRDAQGSVVIAGSPKVFPLRLLCASLSERTDLCTPQPYEGLTIERTKNRAILDPVNAAVEKARAAKARPIGITLADAFNRSHDEESALGNLFADLLLRHGEQVFTKAGRSATLVALMNGGGLRQNLPKGPLSYGALFEAMPFDNRVAYVQITTRTLRRLIEANLEKHGSYLSMAGVRAQIRSTGNLELRDMKGLLLQDEAPVILIASDFLILGGDNFWGPEKIVEPMNEPGALLRDALETELVRLSPKGDASAPLSSAKYLDAAHPRLTREHAAPSKLRHKNTIE